MDKCKVECQQFTKWCSNVGAWHVGLWKECDRTGRGPEELTKQQSDVSLRASLFKGVSTERIVFHVQECYPGMCYRGYGSSPSGLTFNNSVLPTQCIYVFCVDLRTNSDYFTVQL